ncbi:OsmC family protein [Chitinimonas naiadis]
MYANPILSSKSAHDQGPIAQGDLQNQLAGFLALNELGSDAISPEQLFAAGYSSCFMKALKSVGGQGVSLIPPEASITADVVVGQSAIGPALDVELSINLPGLDREIAQQLIQQAHLICPYAEVAPGQVEVKTVLL